MGPRRVPVFAAALLLAACSLVAGQIELKSALSLAGAANGFTFAVSNGNEQFVVATKPAVDGQAVVMTAAVGATNPTGQAAIAKSKGHVTCGCIATVGGKKYLFAGLSVAGYIARVDLAFPADSAVTYLNATAASLWGANNSPQPVSTALCHDGHVFFGTTEQPTSTTLLRLDTASTDPSTRFASLDVVGTGDVTQSSAWRSGEVLFLREASNGLPLTFFVVDAEGFELKFSSPVPTLPHFDTVSGMAADALTERVVLANGNGLGRVATLDMSVPSAAVVEQNITLSTAMVSPITGFVVDTDARYAYAVVGDCEGEGEDGVGLVAIRLAPTMVQSDFELYPHTAFDCASRGVPVAAVLVTAAQDTTATPPPRRRVLAFTQLGDSGSEGAVVAFSVYPAGQCANDCFESEGHGECAGSQCYCYRAWTGASCNQPIPCGGNNCSGRGECVDSMCDCEVGWGGEDCSTFVPCPLSCSQRGTCVQGRCNCSTGFTGAGCELRELGCEGLNNCSSHGTCQTGLPAGRCQCDAGYAGSDCSFVVSSCPGNCTGHGLCLNSSCVCSPGWTGEDCSSIVVTCPRNCSGHGTCSHGRCSCFPGFRGAFCGSVDRATCENGCSAHGSCLNGACVCDAGWSGERCEHAAAALRVAMHKILVAGENRAATSFYNPLTNQVVFCVASTPGKCISVSPDTLERRQAATFTSSSAAPQAHLLQEGEGVDGALVPGAPVALLQTGADIGAAPISVSVVYSSGADSFVLLGTKQSGNSTMHGQILKVSLSSLELLGELEFEDDTGRGVTAGTSAGDGTFFFASGDSPGMIYRVTTDLEIKARVSIEQAPPGEVTVLLYDGSRYLVAASERTLYWYEVTESSIEAVPSASALQLPAELGPITAGVVDRSVSPAAVVLATGSSPAAVVKATVNPSAPALQPLRLRAGENEAAAMVAHEGVAYIGLGSDGASCPVAKVSLAAMKELDAVLLADCSAPLVSASISDDARFAYFGNAASPAHIYSVRLYARAECPHNCTLHGECVDGTCSCSEGWEGDDCSVRTPACLNACSHAGECINGQCVCSAGHFGADCSVVEICRDMCQFGSCTGANGSWPCTCESTAWVGVYCSERAQYCPNECSNHGACEAGVCVCNPGYSGSDCSTEQFPPVAQRSCTVDADCGTHGVCRPASQGTGMCECGEGWSGDDCDVDEDLRADVETSKISPWLITVLVAAAVVVGMIAGVSVWKSWAAAGSADEANAPLHRSLVGGPAAPAPATGYTRVPRRLVKS